MKYPFQRLRTNERLELRTNEPHYSCAYVPDGEKNVRFQKGRMTRNIPYRTYITHRHTQAYHTHTIEKSEIFIINIILRQILHTRSFVKIAQSDIRGSCVPTRSTSTHISIKIWILLNIRTVLIWNNVPFFASVMKMV